MLKPGEPINTDPRILDPYGRKCLEWYRGIFDSVYFAFHPFVSISALDLEKVFWLDDRPPPMSLEEKNAFAKERLKFFAEVPKPAILKAM